MSDEVKIYMTERVIDGRRYGEEICARSWNEAERTARLAGVKLLGEAVCRVCAVTGEEVINFIIKNALVRADNDAIFIWSPNAPEQLDAFLSNPEPIRAQESE